MIKPAYSVSFLLSINIVVWQNVLYFLDAPRTLQETKTVTYKTLVRPVLTYTEETWTTTKRWKKNIIRRKILRRIYGPICERGQWRKRYNRENSFTIK